MQREWQLQIRQFPGFISRKNHSQEITDFIRHICKVACQNNHDGGEFSVNSESFITIEFV